jgi:hypothetical protein
LERELNFSQLSLMTMMRYLVNGKWCLNLWYVTNSLGHNHFPASDLAELKDNYRDSFLMLRHN